MTYGVVVLGVFMSMNNHVHSAPQSKEEENREERKKNHTIKQTKMPTA